VVSETHNAELVRAQRARAWPDISDAEWLDWRWQLRARLTSRADLERLLVLSEDERNGCDAAAEVFALGVTPYYASMMSRDDPRCPIRRQVVPTLAELDVAADEQADPLAEDRHAPTSALTHRYRDRALIFATHTCPAYCRHCNRRRKVGDPRSAPTQGELAQAIAYVREHSEIRDVILSGGDPLTLSDERLGDLLAALRAIAHVEVLRLATRAPVTLPQRITPALCRLLKRFHPIFINTHFNHPREATPEAAAALARLADAGCVLGNQMVLLRGINDELDTVEALNRWLLRQRCRPYYIFQADLVHGIGHFRTPLAAGTAIIKGLRARCSGLAVPHFVVDLPGGGGKVPVTAEAIITSEAGRVVFRGTEGELVEYHDV